VRVKKAPARLARLPGPGTPGGRDETTAGRQVSFGAQHGYLHRLKGCPETLKAQTSLCWGGTPNRRLTKPLFPATLIPRIIGSLLPSAFNTPREPAS
jgi:hypothetical protein